jgi:hypothetical protein
MRDPVSRLVQKGSTSMGWRKRFLHEQEQAVARKDDVTLTEEAFALWVFIPQLKELLPSQGWRKFRLMQIAIHRELGRRQIYPYYVDVGRASMSILPNFR